MLRTRVSRRKMLRWLFMATAIYLLVFFILGNLFVLMPAHRNLAAKAKGRCPFTTLLAAVVLVGFVQVAAVALIRAYTVPIASARCRPAEGSGRFRPRSPPASSGAPSAIS